MGGGGGGGEREYTLIHYGNALVKPTKLMWNNNIYVVLATKCQHELVCERHGKLRLTK